MNLGIISEDVRIYDSEMLEELIYLLKVRYKELDGKREHYNANPDIDPVITISGKSIVRAKYMDTLTTEIAELNRRLVKYGVDVSKI